MNTKLKSIFIYAGAGFSNLIAWFDVNSDLIVKLFAICASMAAVVLAFLNAVHLRQKYENGRRDRFIKDEQIKQEIIKTKLLEAEIKFKDK